MSTLQHLPGCRLGDQNRSPSTLRNARYPSTLDARAVQFRNSERQERGRALFKEEADANGQFDEVTDAASPDSGLPRHVGVDAARSCGRIGLSRIIFSASVGW